MSLNQMRNDLHKLLNLVIAEHGVYPGDDASKEMSVYGESIPPDLLDINSAADGMLWLIGSAADQYWQCLRRLLREGEDGELEHLPQRDIQRSFWRLVCNTWLVRATVRPPSLSATVEGFIAAHRRPQEAWEVLWEINDLTTEESFTVADVEFFAFEGAAAERWRRPQGHLWREVEEAFLGRTFARATVQAGTKEKALLRGKAVIDDALNLLRVVLTGANLIPDQQLLQQRGLHYYAGISNDPKSSHAGGQRGFEPYSLGIGGELRNFLRERVADLEIAFDRRRSPKLREPILRSLLWVGSSIAREDLDDKVVDLCTALECVLSLKGDVRKAEAMAVRYMLLGIAIDEHSYVVHPLDIYHLYLLRNDIIHGSARRVCGKKDNDDLQYVALDAITRVTRVVADQPLLNRMSKVFDYIGTEAALKRVLAFVKRHASSQEAVQKVGGLAELWLADTQTRCE